MPRKTKSVRPQCVWTVALLLPCALHAQNAALHITVVSGEGAIHAAGARVTKPLVIEVSDGTGKGVEGARASFQLPEEGPGGVFSNGLRTDLAVTDSSGRATLRGLQVNTIAGPFNIRVTAAKDQSRAGIVVKQSIGVEIAAADSAARKATQAAPVIATASNPEPANVVPEEVIPAKPKPPATVPVKAAIQANAPAAPAQPKVAAESPVSVGQSRPARVPTIVITQRTSRSNSERGVASGHKSHKRWVWIGILAAGGVAGAFTGSSLGNAAGSHGASGMAGASTAAISIGTPNITLGKP